MPPRPPPPLQLPNIELLKITSNPKDNPEFTSVLQYGIPQLDSWVFKSEISEIDDNLYLCGNSFTKKDLDDIGITHILNISCQKDPEYTNIETLFISMPDGGGLSEEGKTIDEHFQKAIDFIQNARDIGGNVLVHCHMGISRSATLVIAYLMKTLNKPYNTILTMVKNKRPIVDPCLVFAWKLMEFQKELGINSPKSSPQSSTIPCKFC